MGAFEPMKNEGMDLKSVSFSRRHQTVLNGINLEIKPGEMVGLIGPNGAGKSTLLKLLIKLLRPSSGQISFGGTDLRHWKQDDLAQALAYLPQNPKIESAFTCKEVVLMGRYARLSRFSGLSKRDTAIAETAMRETGTQPFSGRPFNTLSGGEQRRVLLARALAQEAALLLLDEPTASLDLRYQLLLLEFVQSLAKKGRAILIALHDLDLAARFCNRLVLLHQGRIIVDGIPESVLTPENLARVYGVHVEVSRHPSSKRLSVIPISVTQTQNIERV